MKRMRKLLSCILAVVMIFSIVPVGMMVSAAAPTDIPASSAVKIEAEKYSSMVGGKVLSDSNVASGGSYIGDFFVGNSISFDVNVKQAGDYSFYVSVGTPNNCSGSVKVDGEEVQTLSIPSSGGWQNYVTYSANMALTKGVHTLTIENTGGIWNVDYILLVNKDASASSSNSVKIEAEDYIAQNGTKVLTNNSSCSGGAYVGDYHNEDFLGYGVNIAEAGRYRISLVVGSQQDGACSVVIGNKSYDCSFAATGDWQKYVEMSVVAELAEGYTYFELLNTLNVWNIDYIKVEYIQPQNGYVLTKDEPLMIEAENWEAGSGVSNDTSTTASGSSNVGHTDFGDYFTYTLDVEEKGIYLATLKVACGNTVGAPNGIKIVSENMGYAIASVPVTGGWQEYVDVQVELKLLAGKQTLKFAVDYEGWNLDCFTLSYIGELSNAATMGYSFASTNTGAAKYINDGVSVDDASVWTPVSEAVGSYAGVRFENAYNINKAVVYGGGITSGKLVFSDGTSIDMADISPEGTEVTFDSKDIYWARFDITGVEGTPYISEFEIHGDPVLDSERDIAFDAYLRTANGFKKMADVLGGIASVDNKTIVYYNTATSLNTIIITGVPEEAGEMLNGTISLENGMSYKVSAPVTGYARTATLSFDKAIASDTFTFTADIEGQFSYDSISMFGEGSVSVPAEYKNVQISVRWGDHSDEIFYLSEDNKLIYTSKNGEYDKDLASWNVVPVGDGTYYTIQNVKTGGYLAILDEENVNDELIDNDKNVFGVLIDCVADGNLTTAGQWTLKNVDGYKRFENAKFPSQAIHVEGQTGYIYAANVPERYHSANWILSTANRYYSINANSVIDTGFKAVANDGTSITSNRSGSERTWTLARDISGSPAFSAPNMPMVEAVYNRTIEETYENMYQGKYGTVFRTGTNWNKVWTRDTAMAVQYSLAWIYPEESENCALEKVVGEQGSMTYEEDTGTGGSYPVSTDRIITTISVWEQYLTTGDKEMLAEYYEYTENTINQDLTVCFDKETGLFKGETGGLDHRDKTYPDWMSETYEESLANIAESKSSIVNIVYCEVYEIMARAADILGYGDEVVAKWNNYREELIENVNEHFWDEEMGLYASWEYPNYMGSPRAFKYDINANGYAVMYSIANEEQTKAIMENYPLVLYGADTVFPQKNGRQGGTIYHNRGVWPGWEGTLMIGAGQEGNNQLADEIWKSCIRGVAMELTNKEVIDFTTGAGVASNNQLWSIAATLAGYYRVLFGMEYTEEGIVFRPYIADWMEGPFELTNYKYRDANLTIKLSGQGGTLVSVKLDGVEMGADYVLPTNLTGDHTLEMVVEDSGERSKINLSDYNHVTCPDLPVMKYENGVLTWTEDSRYTYKLWNGEEYIEVSGGSYTPPTDRYGVYSLVAVAEDGIVSEMSRPITINAEENVIKVEAEDCTYNEGTFATSISGYSGTGYVNDFMGNLTPITFTVDIEKAGTYYLSAVYNNKGDSTGGNYCGIRSVYVDGEDYGTVLMPVMSFNYQTSTHLTLNLSEGTHTITFKYDDANWYDRNMNKNTNNVGYDYFTLEYADGFTTTAEAPESVVKNEKFNITVVTDRAAKDLKVMNESGRKVTSKVTSVTVNEDGSNTVVLELSVGTAGEARVLSIYAGDKELTTVTLEVLKYVTGILSVEAPAAAAKNELFKVKTITTNDLIKGKFKNESGSVIGSKCVSRVRSGDTLVSEYELSIGSSGEKRTITFYADYDKRSDFPFSESFTIAIVD